MSNLSAGVPNVAVTSQYVRDTAAKVLDPKDISPSFRLMDAYLAELRQTQKTILVGLDQYSITGVLGHGRTAVVFDAVDTASKKAVAIKWLPDTLNDAKHQAHRDHCLREAAAYAMVQDGTSVTQLIECGFTAAITPGNLPGKFSHLGRAHRGTYIILEKCADRLGNHLPEEYDRVHLSQDLQLFRSICKAVSGLHTSHIVHRDLVPANIFFNTDSRGFVTFKLGDLGIFGVVGETRKEPLIQRCGTPGYASPEQLSGASPDVRMDIFTLGVILHETLTGKSPFAGRNFSDVRENLFKLDADTLYRLCLESYSKPTIDSKLPRKVRQLISSMLSLDPNDRPQSIDEVMKRVDAADPGKTLSARIGNFLKVPGTFAAAMVLIGGVVLGLSKVNDLVNPGKKGKDEPPAKTTKKEH